MTCKLQSNHQQSPFFFSFITYVMLQMSNYSYFVLCFYLPVGLWNWSLSAAQCDTAELECMYKNNCLQAVSRAIVSVNAVIGTSPVVTSPCVLLQCVLWPGRWLPVTHQPLAHYLSCVVMVNFSSHSLWNDMQHSYQQLIT